MRDWTSDSVADAKRHRRTITALEAERRKLLHAYQADAIGLDLLKEEQERITSSLAKSQAALSSCEQRWENIEAGLDAALALLANCQLAYQRAAPPIRRRLNQVFIKEIYVDINTREELRGSRLATPFAELLAEDLIVRTESETKNPGSHARGRGLNKDVLVELRGFEPRTSAMRMQRSSQLSYSPSSSLASFYV